MSTNSSDQEADLFFARYTNPTAETIARLQQEAHPDGDIHAIVAEADRYWGRVERARATRIRSVTDYSDPFGNRDENARRPYASPEALAVLPAPAFAKRPLQQRYTDAVQAHRFWTRISKPENRDRAVAKARAAADNAEATRARAKRAAAKRRATLRREAALATARQQRLQRTLEHVRRIHAAREAVDLRRRAHRLRTEVHPAGITLDRALEIAMRLTPPQPPR